MSPKAETGSSTHTLMMADYLARNQSIPRSFHSLHFVTIWFIGVSQLRIPTWKYPRQYLSANWLGSPYAPGRTNLLVNRSKFVQHTALTQLASTPLGLDRKTSQMTRFRIRLPVSLLEFDSVSPVRSLSKIMWFFYWPLVAFPANR
jgi:hypothetical protein